MRSLAIGLALVAAPGCHHARPAHPAPANAGGEPAPPLPAPGTSGFPGLDWGASADQVRDVYPKATRDGLDIRVHGEAEGRPAELAFQLDARDQVLGGVVVTYDELFTSMDACAAVWATTRAALDARFGASERDDLAAYWQAETTWVAVACYPDDHGGASLTATYSPPAEDE